jgi:hypothetical protein
MKVRQTSIDCYNQIKSEGLLTKRRLEVYEAIYNNAPCTSSEALQNSLNGQNVLSQSRARFTELRNLGVIYEKGTRVCRVTGRNVIEWDLTDRLPKKVKERPTTKEERKIYALRRLTDIYEKGNVEYFDYADLWNLIKLV